MRDFRLGSPINGSDVGEVLFPVGNTEGVVVGKHIQGFLAEGFGAPGLIGLRDGLAGEVALAFDAGVLEGVGPGAELARATFGEFVCRGDCTGNGFRAKPAGVARE
jgi:hypothetical protein